MKKSWLTILCLNLCSAAVRSSTTGTKTQVTLKEPEVQEAEKKQEISWHADFDHIDVANRIQFNIKYSPAAITFSSCCQVYSYSAKRFILPVHANVKVHTADVRSSSVPTVYIKGVPKQYSKTVFTTLIMVTAIKVPPQVATDPNTCYIYTNWMVVNIRNGDVGTGITVKEYEGPHPTPKTDTKAFFLLYSHSQMVNVSTLGQYNYPRYSRYEMDLKLLVNDNEMVLIASRKMLVDLDEYSRYRSITESGEPESEICSNVPNYPKACTTDTQDMLQTLVRK